MPDVRDGLPKHVRKFVFDHFRERSTPPVLEDVMRRFSLGRDEAYRVLQDLESARHVRLVPGTQRILMAFPFSAVATPFRVTAEKGRRYFANCAWDAIALHATLEEDVRIDSHYHDCATDLGFELRAGQVREASHPDILVHISIPAAHWWDDIVNTCSNHMVFFMSRDHLSDWRSVHPGAGEALTVEQTHRLGFPICRDKMDLDYARPPKEQLVAHFESMGLTSDFWRL